VGTSGTARQGAGGSTQKVVSFALLGLAALTGLSLASITHDPVTTGLLAFLRCLFGWGVYLIPFAVGIVGFWMLLQSLARKPGLQWRSPLASTLLFAVSLAAAHLFSFPEDPRQLAVEGGGGGYGGYALSQVLIAGAGTMGAYVIVLATAAIGLILLSGTPLSRWSAYLQRVASAATERWKRLSPRLTFHRLRRTELSAVSRWKEKITGSSRPS
jgi:hypothetical protein